MPFESLSISRDQVAERLRSIAAPIFAATSSGDVLIVHVSAVPRRGFVRGEIRQALSGLPAGRITVRFHTQSSLLAPRSLERLVKRFTGSQVLYDPTGSVGRAKRLVASARAARAALGVKVGGVFYAPRLRSLYVSLDARHIAVGEKIKVGELAAIEREIVGALSSSFDGQLSDCPAVRVGFGVPEVELVPVDQRSVVGWAARIGQAARRHWKPIAVAAVFGFGASTAAAEGPAVSQTNLKVTGTVGSTDDEDTFFIGGALTAPLGESWGLQLEAGTADNNDSAIYGVGGHLFTRDPDSHLLGVFASYASEDQFDLDATRLGAEAEIYLTQVSLLAKAGYQFSDSLGDGGFGEIELRWYLNDNFALSGGGSFDENNSFGRVGAEWQPAFSALPGLAFRVDGVFGDDDYDSILGGITYYFGADASLKDRHRRQDPDSALFSLFQSVQQEQSKLCAIYGPC